MTLCKTRTTTRICRDPDTYRPLMLLLVRPVSLQSRNYRLHGWHKLKA